MRKDITIEHLLKGGEKLNKSALARQYNCCWETICKCQYQMSQKCHC